MRFSVTLSQTDFAEFQKIIRQQLSGLTATKGKLMIATIFAWIPFGFAFAAYAALYRKYPSTAYDLTVVAISLGVGIVLMLAGAFYKQFLFRQAILSQQGCFLAEQTIDINPEGICVSGQNFETKYQWATFLHLAEDATNLYLFVDNAQAIILPKAALGSAEHISQVRSWLHAERLRR